MRRPRALRLVAAPLAVAALLALSACGDDDGGATTEGRRSSASQDDQARADAMTAVIDRVYEDAVKLWKRSESFPTTKKQFEALSARAQARIKKLEDPEPERWSVVTYRGDYGGNKGLLACTPGTVTLRVVVPEDGRSIGLGANDGTIATVTIYDPSKVGDERFNEDGFFRTASPCATDDTELDATEKTAADGEF